MQQVSRPVKQITMGLRTYKENNFQNRKRQAGRQAESQASTVRQTERQIDKKTDRTGGTFGATIIVSKPVDTQKSTQIDQAIWKQKQ